MEIVFLARAGRGGLRVRPVEYFHRLFLNAAFQAVDFSVDQVIAADEIRFNPDPYDALIVATAQMLDLPLITRDAVIVDSDLVRTLW
jgi:PIN domain nuclease of toxin-antitoxin system